MLPNFSLRGFALALAGTLACCRMQAQARPAEQLPVEPAAAGAHSAISAEAVRQNDLGVAYLNQQLGDKALLLFQQAIAKEPTFAVAHLNAGITLLALQKREGARLELQRAAELDPKNSRAWYNLGLLDRAENNTDAMRQDFERVVAIDPRSADGHYFLGLGENDRKDYAAAIREFRAALAIVPLHASAEFALARALQRTGDAEGAKQHLEHFQLVTQQKLAVTLAQTYGDQGVYSLAEEVRNAPASPGAMVPISLVAMPLQVGMQSDSIRNAPGMCLLDRGGKGVADLVVVGAGSEPVRIFTHGANGLAAAAISASAMGIVVKGSAMACAAGDFDNDGHEDLAIATETALLLFRNRGDGTFAEATVAAGLTDRNRPSSVMFVDFDHDGDLDLFVTGAPIAGGGANVLWRNNGNSTFTEWTTPTALGGGSVKTESAVLSDVDNDRAVDLLTAGAEGVTVYRNPREGAFLRSTLHENIIAPAVGITMLDFNKDGLMDVAVAESAAPGVALWRNVDGARFVPVALPLAGVTRAWSVVAVDLDNDGWIDLAALVETAQGTELRLLRNTGPGGFVDVTESFHLDAGIVRHARSLLAMDADGDGDADLVLATAMGGITVLRNDGGNRNHAVAIVPRGLADNKSAIGTKVEVFAAGVWQKWEINGRGGNQILAGLGSAARSEIVRLLWPTGVPQDEIDPAAAPMLAITETDRRGSSCPIVFAWNGEQYVFQTDIIGAAVVGHWVGPNARNTADPDEWIRVPGRDLKPMDGLLSLRVGEPMEEVNYLDQVRLTAVDHPVGTEVYPNERFKADPPFPPRETILARHAHPVAGAWDDSGRDVFAALRTVDHEFVHDFDVLQYAGFTNMHSLTLDLGAWSPAKPLRLLMTGYIEYFSASSMYAAWQAGMTPISPSIEAQLPDGSWTKVIDDMGFPAGLNRTIVADLSDALPAGTRRIRITTNLQIYWDQVLVLNDAPAPTLVHETELPLASARLAHRGYPKQIERASPGDLTYDYSQRSQTGPFIAETGLYTRYGDVTPLLTGVDDRFAVFGTGEDIDVEFRAAALPPLPYGWARDYFFYADGYVKDMDFYEAMPFTVRSLPFERMSGYPYTAREHFPETPASVEYQLEWNDRVLTGDSHRSHALHYVAAPSLPERTPVSP